MGNDYLNWLGIWKKNINMGLTTWAETSDVKASRSDCHAWGASPNIEFYRIILGIDSNGTAFKDIKITPHLGKIQKIAGEMPHPNGNIIVDYEIKNNQRLAAIQLPIETTGTFVWQGKSYILKGGNNTFKVQVKQ
jgi:hypothetical protein